MRTCTEENVDFDHWDLQVKLCISKYGESKKTNNYILKSDFSFEEVSSPLTDWKCLSVMWNTKLVEYTFKNEAVLSLIKSCHLQDSELMCPWYKIISLQSLVGIYHTAKAWLHL